MSKRAQYGLIGNSLVHSASPGLFQKILRPDKPIPYACFQLETISALPALLKRQTQLKGLNVTVPFKLEVLRFVDKIDPVVADIGASNTLYFDAELGLCAFNTDVVGTRADLKALLGAHEPQSVLILGTGGAARAVAYTLENTFKHPSIVFASRRPTGPGQLKYEQVNAQLGDFDLIINTTPVGMHPENDTAPDLNYDAVTTRQFVWDVIYNPPETLYLKQCAAQGAKTRNGWNMLVEQARASLEIWEAPLDISQLRPNPWQQESIMG